MNLNWSRPVVFIGLDGPRSNHSTMGRPCGRWCRNLPLREKDDDKVRLSCLQFQRPDLFHWLFYCFTFVIWSWRCPIGIRTPTKLPQIAVSRLGTSFDGAMISNDIWYTLLCFCHNPILYFYWWLYDPLDAWCFRLDTLKWSTHFCWRPFSGSGNNPRLHRRRLVTTLCP